MSDFIKDNGAPILTGDASVVISPGGLLWLLQNEKKSYEQWEQMIDAALAEGRAASLQVEQMKHEIREI